MAERLTPLTSRIDALKRQLFDALQNPADYASMLGGRVVESGQAAKALQSQAFADPRQPFKVTDENALRQLTDMMMAGPLGFAPVGIISPQVAQKVIPQTKVVDEGSLPMPVYRGYQSGTGRNEYTFYTSKPELADLYSTKLGNAQYEVKTKSGDTYFYDTLEQARYAKKFEHGGTIKKIENAPTVEQSYLNFLNPLVVDAGESNWNSLRNPFADPEVVRKYEKELAAVKKDIKVGGRPYTKEQQIADINNKYYFEVFTDTNNLAELAKQKGYDGLVVRNVYDIPQSTNDPRALKSDVYVAFEPTQIRSAISDPEMSGLLAP
jgi:hypothetical protein